MIDVHAHLGRFGLREEPEVTEEELLRRMEELGIERMVLLPIVSPEGTLFISTTERVLEACERHPDKFVPFCNIDPRAGGNSPEADFSWILEHYKSLGCRGVGEVTANLYVDDPRTVNLLKQCGEAGLPVLVHFGHKIGGTYGLVDDLGLPRLERVLRELPQTVVIAHAPAFWSEISADVTEETRGGYPEGPVREPGRAVELLRRYPNLYADLSAGSGYNAISRDTDFGYRFLEEFQDKLLFGTDICHVGQEVPVVGFLKQAISEGRISREAFEKITRRNAERLLGL